MFTGIVEELGQVIALQPREAGAQLTVACSGGTLQEVALGASIAWSVRYERADGWTAILCSGMWTAQRRFFR